MNEDNNTLIKQNPSNEKNIYTTRFGRQVRTMTKGCDSSDNDNDNDDPYYDEDSNSDNNIKLKRKQYLSYKKERLTFYCPYKGCNASENSKRAKIVRHIRVSHDSSIKLSKPTGAYAYVCHGSGQKVLFDEESRGTLKPNDQLHLVKKKELQQQTVAKTEKIEFAPVVTTKILSIDSVHDHDDFASKKTTKEAMTKGL
ncbi:hypothetical protein INT45_011736 [Circinella minor]|uniref:Uncharacterized protein n=1 Tax=Circinella minor TaxID=1195481 RepID=A0A8H7VT45_9FUNG|nr:hypothetical protein INT45_011736 [Circinella minor]